jgi:hypothetical protein
MNIWFPYQAEVTQQLDTHYSRFSALVNSCQLTNKPCGSEKLSQVLNHVSTYQPVYDSVHGEDWIQVLMMTFSGRLNAVMNYRFRKRQGNYQLVQVFRSSRSIGESTCNIAFTVIVTVYLVKRGLNFYHNYTDANIWHLVSFLIHSGNMWHCVSVISMFIYSVHSQFQIWEKYCSSTHNQQYSSISAKLTTVRITQFQYTSK